MRNVRREMNGQSTIGQIVTSPRTKSFGSVNHRDKLGNKINMLICIKTVSGEGPIKWSTLQSHLDFQFILIPPCKITM